MIGNVGSFIQSAEKLLRVKTGFPEEDEIPSQDYNICSCLKNFLPALQISDLSILTLANSLQSQLVYLSVHLSIYPTGFVSLENSLD